MFLHNVECSAGQGRVINTNSFLSKTLITFPITILLKFTEI